MQVTLDHVTHTYQPSSPFQATAIQDVSLTIQSGEFLALIGHTGSGKSTLAQHINGLLRPTGGQVLIDGEDIHSSGYSKKTLRQKVGLVFQYPEHQLFETTVVKDVEFGPKNMKLPQLEVNMRTFEAIKLVGISDELYDASPVELSGGQKRRVAIAGVLAMKPDVLILDEPTAGLDPMGRDEILDQIAKIQKERKITVILVSHSMEDVAKYVDRLIVMDHGCVRFDGTPKEVFRHYKELETMGLAAPQVTYVMQEMRKKGMSVGDATTVEEAKKEILKYWRQI